MRRFSRSQKETLTGYVIALLLADQTSRALQEFKSRFSRCIKRCNDSQVRGQFTHMKGMYIRNGQRWELGNLIGAATSCRAKRPCVVTMPEIQIRQTQELKNQMGWVSS
ncbi:hypothetical protein BDN72DRAFT_829937 [Pluteus cervinus]|uniref:Uncharacterized protein n=1 Tax=Pluteus cervinus TaxID=181527 RepID=A0ACD3BGH9_9AGAR|nr:hypothetical protein BDN72DRAFT_829937 [Pluteus cervinus]